MPIVMRSASIVMAQALAELRYGIVAHQHESGFKYGHNFAHTPYTGIYRAGVVCFIYAGLLYNVQVTLSLSGGTTQPISCSRVRAALAPAQLSLPRSRDLICATVVTRHETPAPATPPRTRRESVGREWPTCDKRLSAISLSTKAVQGALRC